ncbi:uncharacterized protein LOC112165837 [Rosa chinensis]|uniref:uncharacterized protein LOC112165837 n=1 Tax=Rosa chinensis TaxID=74649 RepID=UPI001AD8D8FC|nr:uncharacterized protein LOC112165837 [Rosa chinensis]
MVSSVSGRWKPSPNLRFLLQSKRNPKEEKLCSSAALLVLPNPKMTRLLEMETSPVAGSMWTWPRWLMFKKEFDSSYVGFMKDGAKWLVKNTEILLCMQLSQVAGFVKYNVGVSNWYFICCSN